MSIQNVLTSVPGALASDPQLVFIATNDTVAAVTATGYLNDAQLANNSPFTDQERVLVGTQTSPNAQTDLAWMSVAISAPNVSLTAFPNVPSNGIAGFPDLVSSTPSRNFVSGITADLGGNGSSIKANLAGLTATGQLLLKVASSTNPVTVTNVSTGSGVYRVNLSGDPGASCVFDYIALLA